LSEWGGAAYFPYENFALARMSQLLYGYEKIDPTTWAYLSSLLMIGLYFKFSRFWSVRNLDLVLLILLAPGLLLVHRGQELRQAARLVSAAEQATDEEARTPEVREEVEETAPSEETAAVNQPPVPPGTDSQDPMRELFGFAEEETVHKEKSLAQKTAEAGIFSERWGYLCLFVAGGFLLVRLLADPTMVRRPLLEPNLTPGGLTFLGCSLFLFLISNVIANEPTAGRQWPATAPGYRLIQGLPEIPTVQVSDPAVWPVAPPRGEEVARHAAFTKALVVLAHLAIVLAMVGIGWRHFDNPKMGVGAATLYLMMPYTAQMTGSAYHAVPAALLLWAVFCYRRPLTAGLFLGLAIGVSYFPVYLLPLWLSFYWQRGLTRFIIGAVSTALVMALVLMFQVENAAQYLYELQRMFGALPFRMTELGGIWGLGWDPWYRVPMLAAFVVLAGSFALWPAQKNLGTLLSCSAAVMLAAQFWHGDGGGLYMAWYLPLLLLTIFRPNLEDRVALSVLGDGWFPRRRYNVIDRAA
jgi:hypothetical protein